MRRPVTKVQTETVTGLQIGLAVLATLGAGSFAMASLPLKNMTAQNKAAIAKTTTLNCTPEITKIAKNCTLKGGQPGYVNFAYTCPNGKVLQLSGTCRSTEEVVVQGTRNCAQKKYCMSVVKNAPRLEAPPKVDIQAPKLLSPPQIGYGYNPVARKPVYTIPIRTISEFADIAFVGRPEESVTFYRGYDGVLKMKVRFVNRGPALLPESKSVVGGTSVSIIFLNSLQKEVNIASELPAVELPALNSGQTAEKIISFVDESIVNSMSRGDIKFVKVVLHVGSRTIGVMGSFDPDISNNILIMELPQTFPPEVGVKL